MHRRLPLFNGHHLLFFLDSRARQLRDTECPSVNGSQIWSPLIRTVLTSTAQMGTVTEASMELGTSTESAAQHCSTSWWLWSCNPPCIIVTNANVCSYSAWALTTTRTLSMNSQGRSEWCAVSALAKVCKDVKVQSADSQMLQSVQAFLEST